MLHSKMGLEMRMRDALDGMEQLASMYAYGRLPADMEILAAESPTQPSPQIPAPRLEAQILQFPRMTSADSDTIQTTPEKHNRITML